MNKKFTVVVREVHIIEVDVEAVSKDHALGRVEKMLEAGEFDYELYHLEYSHTLGREDWTVREKLQAH